MKALTFLAFCVFCINPFITKVHAAPAPEYIHVEGPNKVKVDCPPEGGVVTTYDGYGNVKTRYVCEPDTGPTTIVAAPDKFEWGLGVQGFYTSADDGPYGGGLEVYFEGKLRMDNSIWFLFNVGPGAAALEGYDLSPTISEFVGVSFEAANRFDIVVGGRHRAIFNGSNDLYNSVLCEIKLGFELTDFLNFHVGGGVGGAWFPTMGPQPGNFPVGHEPPIIALRGDGFAWSLNLGLMAEF